MSDCSYLYVKWLHSNDSDPVHLYYELDNQRFDRRKIEIFRDGRKWFADTNEVVGDTDLSYVENPPVDEIAQDPQFLPRTISQDEFESQWAARRTRAAKEG